MKRIGTAIVLLAAATGADWKSLSGEQAPDLQISQWFNQADGSSLADFRGKAILLEYWATW